MIRTVIVGGNTNGEITNAIIKNGDIQIVKSFPTALEFYKYLTETYEGLVAFDKVAVLQHAFGGNFNDTIDMIKKLQNALIIEEDTLDPLLYFLLTDEEVYIHYQDNPDSVIYTKTSMLLFRKIGFKDIYSTITGHFDMQGIYHKNFPNINTDHKSQKLREELDAADVEELTRKENQQIAEEVKPTIAAPQLREDVQLGGKEPEQQQEGLDYPAPKKGGGLSSFFGKGRGKGKDKADPYSFDEVQQGETTSEQAHDVSYTPTTDVGQPEQVDQHEQVDQTEHVDQTEQVSNAEEQTDSPIYEEPPVVNTANPSTKKRVRNKQTTIQPPVVEEAPVGEGLDLGGGGLGSKLFGGVLGNIKKRVNSNPEYLPDGADYQAPATDAQRRRRSDIDDKSAPVAQGSGLRRGILLITGDRKSGVSSTAANMAQLLSKQGSVVLLDLDFKRAGVSRYFSKHIEKATDIRNTYSTYAALHNPSIFGDVGFVVNKNLLLLTLTEPTSFIMDPEFPWTEKIGGRTREELRQPRYITSLISYLRGVVDYVVIDTPMELLQQYPDIVLQSDTSLLCMNNSEEDIHNTLLVSLSDIYESNTSTFNAIVSRLHILLTNYNNICRINGKETTPSFIESFIQSQGGVWGKTRCVGYIPHIDDFVSQVQNGKLIVQQDFTDHFYNLTSRM